MGDDNGDATFVLGQKSEFVVGTWEWGMREVCGVCEGEREHVVLVCECEYMCGGEAKGRNVGGWGIVRNKEGCACVSL